MFRYYLLGVPILFQRYELPFRPHEQTIGRLKQRWLCIEQKPPRFIPKIVLSSTTSSAIFIIQSEASCSQKRSFSFMLSRCRRRYHHLHTGTLLSTSATISTPMTRTPTHHMFCRLLWPTTTRSDGALLISATWWIARSPAARASGASRHSSTGLPTSASCERNKRHSQLSPADRGRNL